MPDDNPKPQLFPAYAVVDASPSMEGDPIATANELVPAIVDACARYQTLADKLRFSLIRFSINPSHKYPTIGYTWCL
jgi:hypothetical protein